LAARKYRKLPTFPYLNRVYSMKTISKTENVRNIQV